MGIQCAARNVCWPFRVFVCLGMIVVGMPSAGAVDLLQSYLAALQQDASYASARANAEAGREALPQARAQLLPSVSISASNTKNDLVSATPNFLGKLSTSQTNYDSSQYTLSIRQPIFRKYQYAQYQQAKAQVEGAEANLEKDREDLGVRVAEAYFEALLAEDQRSLIQAQQTAYDGQLQSAKRTFQAGLGTRTDIDEAQAKYDMSVAQELEARQNTDYTRRQLQAIINQPVTSLVSLDATHLDLAPPVPAGLQDWVVLAEQSSPELRSLRAQTEAAAQEVEKARSGHFPTLDLVAQRERSESQTVTSVGTTYLSSQIGVQLSIPIYGGGYTSSMVRQARANQEKAERQLDAARRNLGVQVEKEFRNVTEGVSKVRALEQAKRSAEQALYSTQKGMQAGTRTQIDVLNAQQQKVNVMRDLAQARYSYIVGRIRLLALTGALGIDEMTTFNGWLSNGDGAANADAASRQ